VRSEVLINWDKSLMLRNIMVTRKIKQHEAHYIS